MDYAYLCTWRTSHLSSRTTLFPQIPNVIEHFLSRMLTDSSPQGARLYEPFASRFGALTLGIESIIRLRMAKATKALGMRNSSVQQKGGWVKDG